VADPRKQKPGGPVTAPMGSATASKTTPMPAQPSPTAQMDAAKTQMRSPAENDAAKWGPLSEEPTRTLSATEAVAVKQRIAARSPLPAVVEQLIGQGEIERPRMFVATHNLPSEPDARLVLVNEPDSPRAASFRVLRHRLEEKGGRVVAVTSADRDEGKSTCAANLAIALGECGRAKVLLVEANLRAPSLAAMFGFMPPECFSTQLEKHREKPMDPWSVVEVVSPSLHVLAVKPLSGDDGRPLLDGVAMGVAMDMLGRAGYDYIVIDTPPVLGSADVNLVEEHCDGVLLTAWARKTSARRVRAAVEQLAPAKILGITLINA
jgi:Mrp family chromosome partitioning ATPase